MRVDEHTIEVAGASVFYRSGPATGVPTLYLHSVPTSSDDWSPMLERTGGIAPDLVGFGRSGKAGSLDYSLDGLAGFLDQLLQGLQVDRVKLVAHGWGAAIGLVFAQRRPERVERLVLCDAIPLLEAFQWPRIARVWRRRGLGELVMGSTNKWLLARTLRSGAVNADAWPDSRIDAVWEQFDQGTQRSILRLHRSVDEAGLAAAGAGLNSLDVPAMVLWGERDPWLDPAFAEAYAAALPQAVLERIPDAGHWPWMDRPAVTDRVVAFLERAAPGGPAEPAT